MDRSARHKLFTAFLFGAAAVLWALAVVATPLRFPVGTYGINGWAAVRNVSPFNRDIQYLLLIASGVFLCIALSRLDCARWIGRVSSFVRTGDGRLGSWSIVAVTGVSAMVIGFAKLAPALGASPLPLHEGEWLGYLFDDGPFLHGWIINVLPTRACEAFGHDQAIVGCARLFRLAWGSVSYVALPLIFYQLFRFDRARVPAAVASVATIMLFALLDQKLYGLYNAGFESLSTAPVRATPLLLLFASVAYAGRAVDRRLPLAIHVLPGLLVPIAFLGNILSGPLGVALLTLLILATAIVRSPRDGVVALLWAAAGIAAGTLLTLQLFPRAINASWESFRYFGSVGRTVFADETPWLAAGSRSTLLLRYSEIPLYVGALAITTAVIGTAMLAKTLRETVQSYLPALLVSSFCGLSFLLVTGVAVSAFGLAVLIPYGIVRFCPIRIRWSDSWCETGRPRWPLAAAVAFAIISASVLFFSQTYFALQSARASLAVADKDRAGFEHASELRSLLDAAHQTCLVSLTSDGTLLLAARRPACLNRHQPLYAGTLKEQRLAVADLEKARPRFIHVSSTVIDNPYVIQSHTPVLWRYVETNYRPAFFLDGRWFWERMDQLSTPQVYTARPAIMGEITRRDRETTSLQWPAPTGQADASFAGIALRCEDGRLCGLAVAERHGDRMIASLKTPFPAARGKLNVLVWSPVGGWRLIAKAAY
jgi:hypothetical protein